MSKLRSFELTEKPDRVIAMKGSLGTLEEKIGEYACKKKTILDKKKRIMLVMKDEQAVKGDVSRRSKIQKEMQKGS